MAKSSLRVHIPQEANPGSLLRLITLMHEDGIAFPNVKSFLEYTNEHRIGTRTELQIFGTICKLLERSADGSIRLSSEGTAVAQSNQGIQADLVHFLMYTGWQDNSRDNTELWAYREVVEYLWRNANIEVRSVSSAINEEIRNKAFELFEEDVSFSPKSIRGIRKWLEATIPPAIEQDRFSRRFFCPPELALLACGWVAQRTSGELGIDYLLTPGRREMICKVCLLDPMALDRVLDWMLPVYPKVLLAGTTAGAYGRFVRFLKWPGITDLQYSTNKE